MAKNDPPTSLRRGFGFKQARSAGAPYRNPRPNYKVDFDLEERAAHKKHPSRRPSWRRAKRFSLSEFHRRRLLLRERL
jgi:hypothetical protein